jgi:hypothetical protein
MKSARSFPERLETTLIAGMLVGIALIAQRYNLMLYKVGLSILVVSTLLQIAVGNLRKDASPSASLFFIFKILLVIVAVLAIGILLVPTFSHLGR